MTDGPCLYCGTDLDSYRAEIGRLHRTIQHLLDRQDRPAAATLRLVAAGPCCHCGRPAEDGTTICGRCVKARYASPDDTCCGPAHEGGDQ